MGVGQKIRELRNKAGLTQKQLADKLYITYQAVSRWENEDAEPSIDMLKRICVVLNCSIDDLFEMEKKEEVKKEEVKEEKPAPTVVEKVIIKETKPAIAVCERCNKPLFESKDIHRVEETYIEKRGKIRDKKTRKVVLCADCDNKRIAEEKRQRELEEQNRLAKIKKKRIHAFIWPPLIAILFIIYSITSFVNGDATMGGGALLTALLAFCFSATMILNNTFLTDMWWEVTSWGLVRMPGIIFSFSFGGLVFLIAMKIFLFILGIVLALGAAALATIIALFVSVFVYPYALYKNIKGVE